jgi:GT2 family glycosyltransferase
MAVRASAWRVIAGQVCRDRDDVMHEDIDLSLHLFDNDMKTVYLRNMICAISARRMDTSLASFLNYMRRFRNTFDAHPDHWRRHKTERALISLYPGLRLLYPVYQKYLDVLDVNPAERIWLGEQIELAEREGEREDLNGGQRTREKADSAYSSNAPL